MVLEHTALATKAHAILQNKGVACTRVPELLCATSTPEGVRPSLSLERQQGVQQLPPARFGCLPKRPAVGRALLPHFKLVEPMTVNGSGVEEAQHAL